jgi:hypothetical protein
MFVSEEGPVSLPQEDGMGRTGFEPASHYLTGKHVSNYTTGRREF